MPSVATILFVSHILGASTIFFLNDALDRSNRINFTPTLNIYNFAFNITCNAPNNTNNTRQFTNTQAKYPLQSLAQMTNLNIDLVNKKFINPVIWATAKNDIIYV